MRAGGPPRKGLAGPHLAVIYVLGPRVETSTRQSSQSVGKRSLTGA